MKRQNRSVPVAAWWCLVAAGIACCGVTLGDFPLTPSSALLLVMIMFVPAAIMLVMGRGARPAPWPGGCTPRTGTSAGAHECEADLTMSQPITRPVAAANGHRDAHPDPAGSRADSHSGRLRPQKPAAAASGAGAPIAVAPTALHDRAQDEHELEGGGERRYRQPGAERGFVSRLFDRLFRSQS